MQILTENGLREVPDQQVIEEYAKFMLMPLERAINYFRIRMRGAKPFPVQGLGRVIPSRFQEDLEIA